MAEFEFKFAAASGTCQIATEHMHAGVHDRHCGRGGKQMDR